jgi:uncharacterized membrane protein YuzA (DUF378 family)
MNALPLPRDVTTTFRPPGDRLPLPREWLAMWFFDFSTLVLIIAAALQLGLQAFFGWDAVSYITGTGAPFVFKAMGIAAVWQLCRQKFV